MPRRPQDLPEVTAPPHLRDRLAQGHPWVYANQLRGGDDLPSGAWVRVRCGNWSGVGLYDARSAIAVRMFTHGPPPDADWVRERVEDAWLLRAPLRSTGTNGYRWVSGENDGLPGAVVDLYGDYAVVQTYADSVDTLVPWITDALRVTTTLRGVVERVPEETGRDRLRTRWGEAPPADLTVQENGLHFRANLFSGQKTGLFLDQRDNREMVRRWSAGRTVLNCFAYTGAFSAYAAAGGAEYVASTDIAPAAIEDARHNMALNGFDPDRHDFIVADSFDLLAEYVADGRRFDLVIVDPPSFARSKQNQYAALRAYTRLNTLAIQCVSEGGLLASSSCTSQVSPEQFKTMLAAAAATADRRLIMVHEGGQPLDHPVAAHFPEGRYLKFVLSVVRLQV